MTDLYKSLQELSETGKDADTAIEFFDENATQVSLTYEKMRRISNDVTEKLRLITNSLSFAVGIYSEQNEMLPVLVLSILKASCHFVYLPVQETVDYLNEWCSNCGICFILSYQKNWKATLKNYHLKTTIHNVNIIFSALDSGKLQSNHNQLAYIMRTSGTTGRFKTVRVPHKAIVPNILHLKELLNITCEDVLFLSSPLTFDPSIVEMFLAFYAGAKLLIVSERLKVSPEKLADVLFEKHKITVLQTTPSLLLRFGNRVISQKILSESSLVRVLVLGGEKFPTHSIIRNWHENNRTRIFNIYGITEVSCWATCLEMFSNVNVPIGPALLKTALNVKTVDSDLETKTELDSKTVLYELFVGGMDRKCLVDSETFDTAPEFRSTGDLIEIAPDGEMYFVGRFDSQVKRFGKKFSLEGLSAMISECEAVDKATVLLADDSLIAFLIPNSDDDNETEFLRTVRSYIDIRVPSYCKPDRYIILTEFPVTEHGKVDKKVLLTIFKSNDSHEFIPFCSKRNVYEGIVYFAKDIVGSTVADLITPESYLWNLCFDSMKALQLVSKLEKWCEKSLPSAYEIVIFKTVNDLCNYLIEHLSINDKRDLVEKTNFVVKRSISPSLEVNSLNRKHPKLESSNEFYVIQKGAAFLESELLKLNTFHQENRLKLNFNWKWNSQKCIDASPLLIVHNDTCSVFIGSHSGVFASLNAADGKVNWTVNLDGRIEATAAVTRCGRYVIVGCYDFSVYFIDRMTSHIYWKISTGDIVKCTACVSRYNGIIFIGSHDGFIYALNYLEKIVKWKVNLFSAVVSTPCVNKNGRKLFVATLNGSVNCLLSDCGTCLWTKNIGKPIFAALSVLEDLLFVGCVDGTLYYFDCQLGDIKCKFSTSAPIFNAPSLYVIPNNNDSNDYLNSTNLIFGNFDGSVFCCDLNANLIWNINLNAAITSSPYVFRLFAGKQATEKLCCCLCTKLGTIYLVNAVDGCILNELTLPGEVFSSAVVWNNFLYVGCRDNNLYCLNLCIPDDDDDY